MTMAPVLLSIAYDLHVPVDAFLERAPMIAARIAQTPGLIWKVWSLDRDSGHGASSYLFRDMASARAFADSPIVGSLRTRLANDVRIDILPVETGLSSTTHAASVMAAARTGAG